MMCRMPSANHSMSKTGAFKNPMIALSGERLKFLKNIHELEYVAGWSCGSTSKQFMDVGSRILV